MGTIDAYPSDWVPSTDSGDVECEAEGLLLTKGSVLYVEMPVIYHFKSDITCSYMRPCSRHYVVGPEHSIMHGRHFYATSCIANTCYGIIHMFIMNKIVTNAEHNDTRTLLRWMLSMWVRHYMDNLGPTCKYKKFLQFE